MKPVYKLHRADGRTHLMFYHWVQDLTVMLGEANNLDLLERLAIQVTPHEMSDLLQHFRMDQMQAEENGGLRILGIKVVSIK